MTTETLHPDHLQPGHMVGPWRVVERLGAGGYGRVFKVEREGLFFALKMALRPVSTQEGEEEETSWRMAREVAAMLMYSPLPHLLRVHAVDCWPHPTQGYLYFVTDYVDGDDWHGWRWRAPPHAAGLLDAFCDVVRTVGELHSRGVYHRDLKAENILIRREDGRPFLIDFGNVRLPGAITRTLGLPPGVMHLLPPEVLAYTRSELWKEGVPFQGGVAADLYALGVLLYQGLTDLHPFNPELSDKQLVAAIATVSPTPPHLLNAKVPRVLSDIALKLLEKRPEDRYPDTEALLQALGKAGEERTSSAWTVPLFPSEGVPGEALSREIAAPPDPSPEPPPTEETQEEGPRTTPAAPARSRRARTVLLLCMSALGLALWLARSTLTPLPEAPKGSSPVSHSSQPSTPSRFLAAWLCAVASLGCPAAQVRPEPEACPEEAYNAMFQELKVRRGNPFRAVTDIRQPAEEMESLGGIGVYQDGPVIGLIVEGYGGLIKGTLLHGRLWTEPGITFGVNHVVMGRYTLAVLPDGRQYPVCMVLGNGDEGFVFKHEGSKPGAAIMNRELPVTVVDRWP
jgi:serine/threonine protein kinase